MHNMRWVTDLFCQHPQWWSTVILYTYGVNPFVPNIGCNHQSVRWTPGVRLSRWNLMAFLIQIPLFCSHTSHWAFSSDTKGSVLWEEHCTQFVCSWYVTCLDTTLILSPFYHPSYVYSNTLRVVLRQLHFILNTSNKLCNAERNHFICCLNIPGVQTIKDNDSKRRDQKAVNFLLWRGCWLSCCGILGAQ